MFYAGQLTVPGPGVPPSIISGKIASQEIINLDKKLHKKKTVLKKERSTIEISG